MELICLTLMFKPRMKDFSSTAHGPCLTSWIMTFKAAPLFFKDSNQNLFNAQGFMSMTSSQENMLR